jgi:RNase H-fold protein (predicted Holliday junction resolvase)
MKSKIGIISNLELSKRQKSEFYIKKKPKTFSKNLNVKNIVIGEPFGEKTLKTFFL